MNRRNFAYVLISLVALLIVAGASAQAPQPQDTTVQATTNTTFTYQGKLASSGAPVNTPTDFQFVLYNAPVGGAQVGARIVKLDRVPVSNGLFSVNLDFGAVFDGMPLYLEVGVRPGGSSDSYTLFSPRTALTAVPYALGLAPGTTVNTTDPVATATGLTGRVALANAGNESAGLRGVNEGTGAGGYGVIGEHKGKGSGVYGRTVGGNGVYGSATSGTGVIGFSESGLGVAGLSSSSRGVTGVSGSAEGVYGVSSKATGVYGTSADAAGVYGKSAKSNGVVGESASAKDSGVYGTNSAGGYGIAGQTTGGGISSESAGVLGTNNGLGYGVRGVATGAQSSGVYGKGGLSGVYGVSDTGAGVYASGMKNFGIYAEGKSGIYAIGNPGFAGIFGGDVQVQGTLTKAGGSFKIDHPLDPANKYLSHSFVESPDMKNIYDGVVTLDAKGEAVVTLPDWFEPLNQDFRYQLTAVGAPGPNLYIAKEIEGNRFSIAGGAPGMKVSWQVTGIRHDAWANAHRISIEEDKPATERGTYLHPAEQGQPESKGVDYQQIQQMKQHATAVMEQSEAQP